MTRSVYSLHLLFSRGSSASAIALCSAAALFLAISGCGSIAAQSRNAEGVRMFQQARYQDALKQFQEAVYADPNNPNGYYNLAAAYHRIGRLEHRQSDLDQAENYYNLCLDRDPNHVECYRGLAVLLAEQGRKEDSFRLIEGWAARQPALADAKIELARLNDEFGNRKAAAEYLLEALAAEPNNARALTALGKIREDAGELAQAAANYRRSLEQDNRQPQVAARLAAIGGAMGVAGGGTATAANSEPAARMAGNTASAPK